jgi:hypothetical protein
LIHNMYVRSGKLSVQSVYILGRGDQTILQKDCRLCKLKTVRTKSKESE